MAQLTLDDFIQSFRQGATEYFEQQEYTGAANMAQLADYLEELKELRERLNEEVCSDSDGQPRRSVQHRH